MHDLLKFGKEIKTFLINTLKHNGFEANGQHYSHPNSNVGVTVKDCYHGTRLCSIKVTIKAAIVNKGTGATSFLEDHLNFWEPSEDEWDMYCEHGAADKILVNMLNAFNKKMFFLQALEDGEELCIYRKPVVKEFITTDIPF